ncbi:RDD family protein [Aureimonas psammosilenae]|uniref:RDD family protein n=1 Tax=Aureimonas psammosilenae TaxID=2495496 RepID=UPI001260798F|nr:RDD family protein [Aureimonas psammosilenae]
MSNQGTIYRNDIRTDLDAPRLYDGVRTRRVMSFVYDYLIVLALSVPAAVVVFLLGILTLGIGWHLYAILIPAIAVIYIGFTMGGSRQATVGMRMAGLRVEKLDGTRMEPPLAVLHGVLFWASVSLLTPFVLLVALFTRRKQLLHDVLLGTVVVRDR